MFSSRARRIALETLEDRTNPAWTITVAGNAVAFTSTDDFVALALSRNSAGFLQHDLQDTGYASPIDLNPNQAGVQSRRVTNLTNLTVTNPGVGTFVSLTDINKNATVRIETLSVSLEAFPSASATLTDTALTVSGPNFRYSLLNVVGVQVTGGAGNNRFDGSLFTGDATFYGLGGHDTLIGGPGDDFLVGADGDDQITGNDGNDQLYGENGNDSLIGGAGFDGLYAGAGTDTIDGGADNDTLSEEVATSATLTDTSLTVDGVVTADHKVESFQFHGTDAANLIDAGAFTLSSVTLYGNGGNDTLIGGSAGNFINAGPGNDSIDGGAGGDTLRGEEGNDTMSGGAGSDYLDAGVGDDLYDAGTGSDTVLDTLGEGTSYHAVLGNTSVSIAREGGTPVAITHGAETFFLDGGPGNDFIDATGFTLNQFFNKGGAGNDTIIGTEAGDNIQGGAGDDSIGGGGGNDAIFAGSGNDTVVGGVGNDFLEGNEDDDSVDGGTGDDRVIGDTFVIFGPTSFPTDGNDTLTGGDGSDELQGGGGTDDYDGGTGFDQLSDAFTDGADHVIVTNTQMTRGPVGGSGTTFFHGVEQVALYGGAGNDIIDASVASFFITVLDGNGGNDSIVGSESADYLAGGDGNDTLRGNGGGDTLTDTSSDNHPNAGGNNLFDGGDGNDHFSLGGGDDVLLGGNGDDDLNAGAGEDVYDGGPGFDKLTDTLFAVGSTGGTAVITDTTITLTRTGSAPPTFVHNIERFEVGGSDGDDVIDGSAFTIGQTNLYGGDGNDLIKAGSGLSPFGTFLANFLRGMGGNDTLIGGPQPDFLGGDDDGGNSSEGDDSIVGGGGDDVLVGLGGVNHLFGQDGNDSLRTGPAGGTADGGADTDDLFVYATPGDDTIIVAETALTINGAALALNSIESGNFQALEGIDAGTQPAPVSFPYTVGGLEPTVTLNPAVNYPARTLGGSGAFIDIGANQSWTGTVDYGDGSDPAPLTFLPVGGSLENRHTFTFNHTYSQSGTYPVTVTVTDDEGNVGTTTTNVVVAPVVTQVRVRYGNGATTFVTFDQLAGRTLPWLNISRFDVFFSDDVSVQSNDLRISGPGSPQAAGFAYSAAERRATWVFGTQFQRGWYTFNLDGDSGLAIADRQGIKLAGGATAGSDYVRQLGVLPGDVTGDRVVNQADVTAAAAAIGGPYSPFADVNGDGVVNILDVRAVQARVGTGL